MKTKHLLDVFHNLTLQARMIIYVVTLVLVVLGLTGGQSILLLAEVQEKQISERALAIANSIAAFPIIAELIESKDSHQEIQSIVEKIRFKTDAEFIVVGDSASRRLSHPDPNKIGQLMVGGDNLRALSYGEEYISRAIGTLGPSLRAKVPIFNSKNEIIGLISIGFLEKTLAHETSILTSEIIVLVLELLLISIVSAILLARSFRKAIFGLEPKEIGLLFKERNAIIESMREGIIATDIDDNVKMLNKAAILTLNLSLEKSYVGMPIDELVPTVDFSSIVKTRSGLLDQEYEINDNIIIVNSIPIVMEDNVTGVVSSFRRQDQIDSLGKELSQLKEFSNLLRAQTHEYSNKLHTISGLIQLSAYDEAVQLISSETSGYQELLHLILRAIPDPIIAGCIIGKYNRAKELGIALELDSESNFTDVPSFINRHEIVTILGNIIDNAFESVLKKPPEKRKVCLSLIDVGHDLVIEIEDSGFGVPKESIDRIFDTGFSTSSGQCKGIGLGLVIKALNLLHGQVTISESALGGALFTVYISKEL
jgi:sensor histidine kinase regulating citrate/malate metabolism